MFLVFKQTPNFWSNYTNYSNFFPKTSVVFYRLLI